MTAWTPLAALTWTMYNAAPTSSASRMIRRNERSSDSVLWTSAMFSKPVRPSRVSFSYRYMTMSSSSAWIAPMPPCFASRWSTSQMWPYSTRRPRRLGVMSVVNILKLGKPAWIVSGIWSSTSGGGAPISMTWKA